MPYTIKAALVVAAGLFAAVPAATAAETGPLAVTIDRGRYKPVSGLQVGTLTCKLPGGFAFGVGSKRQATCEYRPRTGRNTVDVYLGRFNRIGVDVGATGPSVVAWAVFAHSSDIGPGDLAGKYRGASASASALIGGGANVLIGGSDITVSLQPLSVEGQTGISISAGYASLRLDPI